MLRTQLKILQDPITLGSNFQFLVRLLVAIKGVSADDPTIFRFMRELIARMSTLQFRQELESSSLEEQIQTLYALVGYESRLFLAWLRYALKPSNITAAMIWDWAAVDTRNALITAEVHSAQLTRLDDFTNEGIELGKTKRFLKSSFKIAKDKEAEERIVRKAGGRKCGNDDRDPDNRGKGTGRDKIQRGQGSKKGQVKYARSGKLPLPAAGTLAKTPCGAHYREGVSCRFGSKCKFDHTPINDLPETCQRVWVRHVNNTPDLSFTSEVSNAIANMSLE